MSEEEPILLADEKDVPLGITIAAILCGILLAVGIFIAIRMRRRDKIAESIMMRAQVNSMQNEIGSRSAMLERQDILMDMANMQLSSQSPKSPKKVNASPPRKRKALANRRGKRGKREKRGNRKKKGNKKRMRK